MKLKHLRVVDQWSYHSRLYRAAEFVSRTEGFKLLSSTPLVDGLDSIVADQVKIYFQQTIKFIPY